MKKKFAYMLMGAHYTPALHHTCFETEKQFTCIVSVNTLEEAFAKLAELQREGVGAVELCGAFGEDVARKMIAATGNSIAIGYTTHLPEQDAVFATFFRPSA